MSYRRVARGLASLWLFGVTMTVTIIVMMLSPDDFRGLDDE